MRIAMLASEGAPFVKSGGLGDVMEALPSALARIPGNEVILLLPYYHKIKANPAYETEFITQCNVRLGWRNQYAGILKLKNPKNNVQVYFIDNLYYFGAPGRAIYGDIDDGERFAFFSKACLDALVALRFNPEIIQCNDWQTAAVPVMLPAQYYQDFPDCRCMFTIHNIEYQGWARGDFFDDVLALPESFREKLDMDNSVNMLKGAITTAHTVTTVSQTYARELMYPYYAHGLDGILCQNADKLLGITNGIDTDVFNPETDKALPKNYSYKNLVSGKAACKAAVQKEVGLPVKKNVPLVVMVTRLAGHKGLDLLKYAMRQLLLDEEFQFLLLGTGEGQYESFFRELNEEFPQKVAAKITFDLNLAARIYAGGDIYLMPSKSEPCGLSQMNAMRYGTVPVVHATGGLKDTVPPADENGENGLGFTFQSYNAHDFMSALKRCLRLYREDLPGFHKLQRRGMQQDFSWEKPAARYMEVFTQMRKN